MKAQGTFLSLVKLTSGWDLNPDKVPETMFSILHATDAWHSHIPLPLIQTEIYHRIQKNVRNLTCTHY